MSDYYRYVAIQTYYAHGEPSAHAIRARPLPDQGLDTSMRVECSSKMRSAHPVPTIFKVWAKVKDSEREPHVYTSWQWEYEVLTPEQATEFIASKKWGIKR